MCPPEVERPYSFGGGGSGDRWSADGARAGRFGVLSVLESTLEVSSATSIAIEMPHDVMASQQFRADGAESSGAAGWGSGAGAECS